MKNHWLKKNNNKYMYMSHFYNYQYIQMECVRPQHKCKSHMCYEPFKHEALFIIGTVYNNGIAVQHFFVNEQNIAEFKTIDDSSVVISGFYDKQTNQLKFCCDRIQQNYYLVCDYEFDHHAEKLTECDDNEKLLQQTIKEQDCLKASRQHRC
jgi:hypothetical protein